MLRRHPFALRLGAVGLIVAANVVAAWWLLFVGTQPWPYGH